MAKEEIGVETKADVLGLTFGEEVVPPPPPPPPPEPDHFGVMMGMVMMIAMMGMAVETIEIGGA